MLAVVLLCHVPKEARSGHSCRGWVGCCTSSRSGFWRSAAVGSCIAVQVACLAVSCQDGLPVSAVTEKDDGLAAMLERQLLP